MGIFDSKRPLNSSLWSTLQMEILEMIVRRLDLADQLRASCVCKSWKSATMDKMSKPFSLLRLANPGDLFDFCSEKLSMKCSLNSSLWSGLPTEILEMIVRRLDLADHLRFSCVCKSWRSAAMDKMSKPFSLVRSANPRRVINKLVCHRLPCTIYLLEFIGGFDEWLILQIRPQRLFLLNPAIGGALIPLPPLPGCSYALKVLLSASPTTGKCTIVAQEHRNWLLYWRLGDSNKGWTYFSQPEDFITHGVNDLVFHKDLLYTIHVDGEIQVYDSALNSSPMCTKFPRFGCDRDSDHVGNLVSAFDKLLLIRTGSISPHFRIFVLDPENWTSTTLESIGDENILFFSPHCSMALLAKDHTYLRSNHLYGNYPFFFGRNYPSPGDAELVSYSFENKLLTRESTIKSCPVFFTLFQKPKWMTRSIKRNILRMTSIMLRYILRR